MCQLTYTEFFFTGKVNNGAILETCMDDLKPIFRVGQNSGVGGKHLPFAPTGVCLVPEPKALLLHLPHQRPHLRKGPCHLISEL